MVLKMSEICVSIITNRRLILYLILLLTFTRVIRTETISKLMTIIIMVVKVKELQEIISTMLVGKASAYDLISNAHFKCANEKLHVLVSLL